MSGENDIWLVAITAGRWQRHGIAEARRVGLKVIAVDADPKAEGFQEADKCICMDINDFEGVVSALRLLNISIRGAISFCSEVGILLAAHIREAFDLPGPRQELCRRLIDKGVQRRVWEWGVCHHRAFGYLTQGKLSWMRYLILDFPLLSSQRTRPEVAA